MEAGGNGAVGGEGASPFPPFWLAPRVRNDAVETIGRPTRGCIVYTCEHASNRVPRVFAPHPADRTLLRMHWGYDIGAAWVTRRLTHLGATHRGPDMAVLSRVSRLVTDVNRAPDDPTLCLAQTDDGPVSFNLGMRPAERRTRLARFHRPFHDTVAAVVSIARPRLLVSVHSFTSVWQGVPRTVEAGVLYDAHDAHAEALVLALRNEGLRTEANEPYSGKAGLIYSAARHGEAGNMPYFEIELRQDLIDTRVRADAVADRVHAALRSCGW